MQTEQPIAEQSAVAAASEEQAPLPAPKAPPACLSPSIPAFAAAQRHSDSPSHVFMFGSKHRGKGYMEVTEKDPGYFFWAIAQGGPSLVLKHYIHRVDLHYEVDVDNLSLINPSTLGMYVAEGMPPRAPRESMRLSSSRQLKRNGLRRRSVIHAVCPRSHPKARMHLLVKKLASSAALALLRRLSDSHRHLSRSPRALTRISIAQAPRGRCLDSIARTA